MTSCVSCGAEVGPGRFCTNCGQPLEWRTDTAERPPARPPAKLPPPAPADLPPRPRFPMYADERPPGPRDEQPTEQLVVPPPPPEDPRPRRGAPWLAWLAVAAVLVLVAGLSVWLVTRSGDNDNTDDNASTATDAPTTEPTKKPTGSGTKNEPIVVPDTAPPNQDVNGNPVSYEAANLLDGDTETCWRMPGDGTGEEITVRLPKKTTLSSVGIVNGYAKTAQGAKGKKVDWYHGNRRVLRVEWVFDNGSSVVQDLDDTTEMQTIDVSTTTRKVVVRLLEVSPPGKGRAARDYTAISELTFNGA